MKIYSFDGKANVTGTRIQSARKSLGLSQDALAARMQLENIEISQKAISRIEKQERFVSDYELRAFARVLHVTVEWLLDEIPLHQGNTQKEPL